MGKSEDWTPYLQERGFSGLSLSIPYTGLFSPACACSGAVTQNRGTDILEREVDSTRLLLAFEYEDVWHSVARNACGYREGLEIGRKFVLLRQCDLAFGPLNHFKGARAEPSC